MNKVLVILLAFVVLSCNNNKISSWDLAIASYDPEHKIDTVIPGVVFGMTQDDLYKTMDYNGKYRFQVDELSKYEFSITDGYFNDSLYKIGFTVMSKTISEYSDYNSVCNLYKLKYGEAALIEKNKETIYTYWFDGNLEISISFHNSEYYNHLTISYVNLGKSLFVFKDSVIRDFDQYGQLHCWTKDYYNNVYLPRKKEELGGI